MKDPESLSYTFNGLPMKAVLFLLSYSDMLSNDAILYIANYQFSNDNFNDIRWNKQLAENFKKYCISFDSQYNKNEFINGNKKIFFDIDDGIIKKLIIRDINNNVLIERSLMKSFREYIDEMAFDIGDAPSSALNNPNNPEKHQRFEHSKNHPVVRTIMHKNNELKLHKHVDKDDVIEYTTNDHKNKETLHASTIVRKTATTKFPIEHEEQIEVNRVKDINKLPKGHATDVTYDHIKTSKFPLKTSNLQQKKGHEMWHRLVDKALDDKHNVYHWDGSKLHKTTQENKKEHLANSFGQDDSHLDKHMLISKHELK